MPQHIRIYPPQLAYPELRVEGSLPLFRAGADYTGRLQIINGIGHCRVQILPDSTVPPETRLTVDSVTHEVVASIPYVEVPQPIVATNLSFEDGDTGWIKGPGIRIVDNEDAHDGVWSAVFDGTQHGLSQIESETFMPVTKGQRVKASGMFEQDVAGTQDNGGRVVVSWYTADKTPSTHADPSEGPGYSAGNLISNGTRGNWFKSSLAAESPEDGFARLGFSVRRLRGSSSSWIDQLTWDAVATFVPEPAQPETDYFLHLRVTDAAGRTADWRGLLFEYASYFTSQLYGLTLVESVETGGRFIDAANGTPPRESIAMGGTLLSVLLKKDVEFGSIAFSESAVMGGSLASFNLINSVIYTSYTAPSDSVTASGSIVAITKTVVVAYQTYSMKPDTISMSGSLQGVTLA